ncbi:MAG: hypothetical protein JW839_03420 [Candidatus Lokiarchaeota archaeon]|nr:hypothetical protein [Candidatus Lokiarchaeota archaeon]
MKLDRLFHFLKAASGGAASGLLLVLLLNTFFRVVIGYDLIVSQQVLLESMMSFFSMMRAFCGIKFDVVKNQLRKRSTYLAFFAWICISFFFYRSATAKLVSLVDPGAREIFMLIKLTWESYISLAFQGVVLISTVFLYQQAALLIHQETSDAPLIVDKVLQKVKLRLVLGVFIQFMFNFAISVFGSFDELVTWLLQTLLLCFNPQ